MYGNRVISNDAGRFKRFYSYFFCPRTHLPHGTRIASPWLPCFTCVTPSLTTPAVSRDFILIFSVHEHTFPTARGSRLHGCLVSLVSPQLARAVLLHRFGVARQTSLRSRSTMMSYAISP